MKHQAHLEPECMHVTREELFIRTRISLYCNGDSEPRSLPERSCSGCADRFERNAGVVITYPQDCETDLDGMSVRA